MDDDHPGTTTSAQPSGGTRRSPRLLGRPTLTVVGCHRDEAASFRQAALRHGVSVTTTTDLLSDVDLDPGRVGRCVSVGHTSVVGERELCALREVGVELVSTRSVGLDHIDLAAAAALGITIENVVYPPDGVADFTLLLTLMAIRHADQLVGAGADRSSAVGFAGRELCDLTVGVLGVGRIGRAVIDRLQGFGARVLACGNGPSWSGAADSVSFDELLRDSDVVSLHLPLTPATHHLIGRDQLAAMRPDAVLVNTGRGALVDTAALIAALESGRLGGAALDVLEGERPPRRHESARDHSARDHSARDHSARDGSDPDDAVASRLRRLPNVIVTPHVAYRTSRALHEIVERTLTSCLDFERKRTNDTTQGRDPVRRMLGGA